MKLIIDIPEEEYAKIKESVKHNAMYLDLYQIMQIAIVGGTVLPDNPTNGEVIQALFPNIYEGFSNVIDLNLWWYAKYKAKEQSE